MSPDTNAPDYLQVPHWASEIPLETPHSRLPILEETGYVVLRDLEVSMPDAEFLGLEYIDWKSGGDTMFAPIASANGELDGAAFGRAGEEQPDKGASFTPNAEHSPTLVEQVTGVGADFGRVRVIRLEPQSYEEALRHIHRDDNNRYNPDNEGWVVRQWTELTDTDGAFMILMEQGADGLPDRSTEVHLPLHRGSRFVIDTQRLWHVHFGGGR